MLSYFYETFYDIYIELEANRNFHDCGCSYNLHRPLIFKTIKNSQMSVAATVDDYIKSFDGITRERLEQMRIIINTSAPGATESISYGMPAYKLNNKPLVYFAGYDKHIGFYATPNGHKQFSHELAEYKQGKGSVQFLHSKPLPTRLVKKIVEFRLDHLAKSYWVHKGAKGSDNPSSAGAPRHAVGGVVSIR